MVMGANAHQPNLCLCAYTCSVLTVDARIGGAQLLMQSPQQVPLLELVAQEIKLGLGTQVGKDTQIWPM